MQCNFGLLVLQSVSPVYCEACTICLFGLLFLKSTVVLPSLGILLSNGAGLGLVRICPCFAGTSVVLGLENFKSPFGLPAIGDHQPYTATHEELWIKKGISKGVVYELSEPKRTAKCTPPPGLHWRCSSWLLWGWCADCGFRCQQRVKRVFSSSHTYMPAEQGKAPII